MTTTRTVPIRDRERSIPFILGAINDLREELIPEGSSWTMAFAIETAIESASNAIRGFKRVPNSVPAAADVELTESQQRMIVMALHNKWQRAKDLVTVVDDDNGHSEYIERCYREYENMKRFFWMPNITG